MAIVIAAATPESAGDPVLVDGSLEQIDSSSSLPDPSDMNLDSSSGLGHARLDHQRASG